jgi:hypothetical protein
MNVLFYHQCLHHCIQVVDFPWITQPFVILQSYLKLLPIKDSTSMVERSALKDVQKLFTDSLQELMGLFVFEGFCVD